MKTYFIYPGGNPTILFDNINNAILPEQYVSIAQEQMQKNALCEQVGFIEKTKNGNYKCAMMGGELCINALRSLGFWIYDTYGTTSFTLESSGTIDQFTIEVEPFISISLPKKYKKVELKDNLCFVQMEGIGHFVQQIQKEEWNEKKCREIFETIKGSYSDFIEDFPAIGYILIDQYNAIYPLVFVRDTETTIFESACGSGTVAACIAQNKNNTCFIQPSRTPYIVEEKPDVFILKSAVRYTQNTEK